MKVIVQLLRNKMRKVYAKTLAGHRQKAEPSQPAVLRGALPAGGILCGVGCTYLYRSVLSLLLRLGQQLWGRESGKRRVKHKDQPEEHFPSPVFYGVSTSVGNPALGCENQ